MNHRRLDEMIKGWFIGDFDKSILRTKDVEVACKYYKAGDYETRHLHKIADEITVIVYGQVQMNGIIYNKGDIVHTEKGEATDFCVLEDTATVVVKVPSVVGDKYPCS